LTLPPLISTDIPDGEDPFGPSPSAPPSDAPDRAPVDEPPTFLGPRGPLRGRRKGTTGDARPARPATPERSLPDLRNGVAQLYAFASVALMPFDSTCATAIGQCADPASDALIALAKESPAVRKFLGGLTATSTWGAVIAANMPIIMTVSAHHFTARGRTDADVVNLHDTPPRNVRHTGASGGAVGKFCPQCQSPVIPGVRHHCPEGA
jgi:hypothetical protein